MARSNERMKCSRGLQPRSGREQCWSQAPRTRAEARDYITPAESEVRLGSQRITEVCAGGNGGAGVPVAASWPGGLDRQTPFGQARRHRRRRNECCRVLVNDGLVLVDSGAPRTATESPLLKTFAPGAKVTTLFNTHYHLDQTGNNELFAALGREDHRARAHAPVDVDRLLGSGRRSL